MTGGVQNRPAKMTIARTVSLARLLAHGANTLSGIKMSASMLIRASWHPACKTPRPMTRLLALTAALAVTAIACGSDSNTITAPTPAPPSMTDVFPGTVTAAFASDIHLFTVNTYGTVQVTLTAASPPATI